MGIKTSIRNPRVNTRESMAEKLFREERDYRSDRLN